MNGDVPVKSLKKALDLLSVLLFQDGEEKGFAVKELGERLGLPANSVHNLLKTMAVCGYAEKNADGRYTYGPVCRQIAYRNYQAGDEFHGMLLEIMRGAIRRINESMVFAVLENDALDGSRAGGTDRKDSESLPGRGSALLSLRSGNGTYSVQFLLTGTPDGTAPGEW